MTVILTLLGVWLIVAIVLTMVFPPLYAIVEAVWTVVRRRWDTRQERADQRITEAAERASGIPEPPRVPTGWSDGK